jgi:hypothetical protein
LIILRRPNPKEALKSVSICRLWQRSFLKLNEKKDFRLLIDILYLSLFVKSKRFNFTCYISRKKSCWSVLQYYLISSFYTPNMIVIIIVISTFSYRLCRIVATYRDIISVVYSSVCLSVRHKTCPDYCVITTGAIPFKLNRKWSVQS